MNTGAKPLLALLALCWSQISPSVAAGSDSCNPIETKYGSVSFLKVPNTDHFAVGSVVKCIDSGREVLYAGREIEFDGCPSSEEPDASVLHVQTAVNEACLSLPKIRSLSNMWLETDLFGSPYIFPEALNVSTECTQAGLVTHVDSFPRGDLRTTFTTSKDYVQLLRDKWTFEDGTNMTTVVAVFEPVWEFVARTYTTISTPKLVLEMGYQQRSFHVSTERGMTVTYSISNISGSGMLALQIVPRDSPAAVYQDYTCTSCVKEKYLKGEKCATESAPLTDTCGRIVGDCARDWWMIMTLCNTCVVPI